jgi:hypothetical protein
MDEVLPKMMQKTLDLHIFPNLSSTTTDSCNFDLWMCRGVVDTFTLMIIFLNESSNLIHVIVGLFEVDETNGKSMVVQLESLSTFKVWFDASCDCICER